jgi:hypothetical protein
MIKPTQHDLEEWQFLVFALRSVGRQHLYVNACAANIIPRVRRWWVEVMMEEYIGPTFKPATQFFTRDTSTSLLGASSFTNLAVASPLPIAIPPPIVIGGD